MYADKSGNPQAQKAGAANYRLPPNLAIRGLLLFGGFKGSQLLHQAALAAGSVVLVQNAFFSRFIQRAGGLHRCQASGFEITTIDSEAGFLDIGAGAAAVNAVAGATLEILTITFDLRLYISQVNPPKKLESF